MITFSCLRHNYSKELKKRRKMEAKRRKRKQAVRRNTREMREWKTTRSNLLSQRIP